MVALFARVPCDVHFYVLRYFYVFNIGKLVIFEFLRFQDLKTTTLQTWVENSQIDPKDGVQRLGSIFPK